MSAWYRTGTVTATNGSGTVTGNLTAWFANAKVGDAFTFDADSKVYEITAVGSNTGITISPVYAGSTGSGKAYGINRTSTAWNSASELSVQIADFINTFDPLKLSQLSDPNADRIPFWDESSGAAGAMAWLTLSGLGISGTTMSVDTDIMSTSRWSAATVASATTTDIFGQTSPLVIVTGNVAITSFGNSPNRLRYVLFTGTPTITHNATTLILPGATNLTVTAGAMMVFSTDSSGNVRWRDYVGSDGKPLGLTTADSPQFAGLNVGHATNNTITSSAAGTIDVEGSRVYQRNNILGTVSQSGGVPTGAEFEYATSSNGAYLRFPDGTQICWKEHASADDVNTSFGSFYVSGGIGVGLFPAAFASTPIVTACGRINTGNAWAFGVFKPTTTQWGTWRICSPVTSSDTDTALYLTAIGRWH